jgi:catechol 2,3-dioxygenase-like lactoylglutathione lyase family enzyme
MILDHIAWRVPDREKLVRILKVMCGYKEKERFEIDFDDGSKAQSVALVPNKEASILDVLAMIPGFVPKSKTHINPEIFVSDGEPDSLIGKWVAERNNGMGGIHHLAFLVNDVQFHMDKWKMMDFEFTTDEPIVCPDDDLVQAFTKPIDAAGGIIFEFIKRGEKGFCGSSVKKLMESTQ